MHEYPIFRAGVDFVLDYSRPVQKGTRTKKLAIIKSSSQNLSVQGGERCFLKYSKEGYETSELCSEKLCYEIARALGMPCARIEFAQDSQGKEAILNFLFTEPDADGDVTIEHTDFADYFSITSENRKSDYTLPKILANLNSLNPNLITGFINIMVFDALVGEQDRHENNWGMLRHPAHDKDGPGTLEISPLYDNSDCLMRELRDEAQCQRFLTGQQNLEIYSGKSRTCIYRETGGRYKHSELIYELLARYPVPTTEAIRSLAKLTDTDIQNIIERIPPQMMSDLQKHYIIQYLILRRNGLCKLVLNDNI